jgi:hypothetical protein
VPVAGDEGEQPGVLHHAERREPVGGQRGVGDQPQQADLPRRRA